VSLDSRQAVFADLHGRRRRRTQIAVLALAILVATAGAYFIWGLLIKPQLRLPAIVRNYRAQFRALPPAPMPPRDPRDDWRRLLPSTRSVQFRGDPTARPASGIVLGYVTSCDPAALLSLKAHAGQLTHVAVEWFSLKGVNAGLESSPDEKTRLFCVGHDLGFLPILRNLDGDIWQPEAVEALSVASPAERAAFFDKLIAKLPPGSKGLLVEFAEIDPTYKKEVSALLRELGEKLHAAGREFWFTVPTGNDFNAFDLEVISKTTDRLVAQLYDENSEAGDPGPLASNDWFQGWLGIMMVYGDPGQWVIGLGAYGNDWKKNGAVETIGFSDAMARASQAGVSPYEGVDCSENSPDFNYLSGQEQAQEHEVWFQDAVCLFNQRRMIAPFHPGGLALYKLGEEDPAVWDVLRMDPSRPPGEKEVSLLSKLSLPEQIASTGEGDFLSVGGDSAPGERLVAVGPDGLLSEHYVRLPMPASISRQGAPGPHQVALTFDDGPDPKWTPKILDILRHKKAPAAFFVLGSQAQSYPDLLERIVREGHEVGNHSYSHRNLAEAGDSQIELELNATTRLIEAVTGHSTAYFRPPYNADGTPTQPGEVRALRVARDLGYLTVGQSVDPDDWEKPGASELLRRVKQQRASGSVILLHDAGGDRSQTVAALPAIIDYLRERGDQIVPLSEMIRLPRDTVMPPLREADEPLSARYVYRGFAVMRFLESAAWTLLAAATLLALFRVAFFSACAARQRRKELRTTPPFSPPTPSVSVLLAAYNEERVIASTIYHVLDSVYPGSLEIVVVDDGSQDHTADVVRGISEKDSRVILLRQANGGKSSALNAAFARSSCDIIVMIDADTMVAPDAIARLVSRFGDQRVGGASGHIRVGNRGGWLGKFQDVEYVTAFQIDRRAQDLLGCMIVLPGALSAFRREDLEQAGPLSHDTLAEDTDLTLQLQRLGWHAAFEIRACADTEAPEDVRALVSQRFRWAFGTLQCLWKHAALTFAPGSGWLGWFAIPSVWIFQYLVVAITPLLDIMVLWSLWWGSGSAIWPYFLASLLLDIALAAAALRLAGRPVVMAWLALPMRIFYRPLLGYVVWKCILKALAGSWVRWSKLERTASAIREKQKARSGA